MRPHRLPPELFAKSSTVFTRISVLVLLAGLLALPTAAQTWTTLPGAAMDIGANASGVVWVIGTGPVQGGYGIYRWSNGNWQNVPGGALRISVDTDGTAWIVNNTHNIFHSNASGQWTMMPGGATDIGVGANGAVWIIGADGSTIQRAVFASGTRTVTGWQTMPGGASRIAVDPNGNAWVVNAGGYIYRWQGTTWILLPGVAKDVAVGADGTAYVVGQNPSGPGGSAVYHWDSSVSNWAQIGVMGANVAAGPKGSIYVTQDATKQYAILAGVTSTQVAGTLTLNVPGTTINTTGGSLVTTGNPLIPGSPSLGLTPLTVDGPPPYLLPSTLPTGFAICPLFQNGRLAMGCQTFLDNSTSTAQYVHSHSGGQAIYLGVKYGGDTCPSKFRDDGDYCAKPDSYGRGGGYGWQIQDGVSNSGMLSRCQNDGHPNGCEMNGAMAYPKCDTNFHAVGCCVCSPDCPSGWDDIGVSCKKPHGAADCSKYPIPGGYSHPFMDPRNGGECWVCPAQLPRSMAKVDSTDPMFPACMAGNDNSLVWQSPQYPEPGIYAFLTKGILSSAFGNPRQVDAFMSQLAGGNATTKAQLWQQMASDPSSSAAFKALVLSAILSAATNKNASIGASGSVYAFQKYIQSRQTFVAQDAVNMYNYYLGINAYQANKAVGAATAGGGFSNTIAGQLGIAPGDYLSAAYAAAFPDTRGGNFITAMSQLNTMTWSLASDTQNTGFDPRYIQNVTATLAFVTDRLDTVQEAMKKAATTLAAKIASGQVGYALAGMDLAGALLSAAVDFSGEVMTLTAQQDARNTYSQLVQNANQPVNLSQILTTGADADKSKLLLWWALATSPYKGGNTAGDSSLVISSSDLCNAYPVQCSAARAAVTQAQAALPPAPGTATSAQLQQHRTADRLR